MSYPQGPETLLALTDELDRLTTGPKPRSNIAARGLWVVLLIIAFRFLSLAVDIGVGTEVALIMLIGVGTLGASFLWKQVRIMELRRLIEERSSGLE